MTARKAARGRRRRARASTPPARLPPSEPSVEGVDERVGAIVDAVSRVARDPGSPVVRLERALGILLDAYSDGSSDLSTVLLEGWLRAQRDKQYRLRLAWQREQLRLLLQDILAEGAVRGVFRSGLDAGAVAAVMVGTAEGCLLQSAMEGGPVSAGELARALTALTLREA